MTKLKFLTFMDIKSPVEDIFLAVNYCLPVFMFIFFVDDEDRLADIVVHIELFYRMVEM